MLRCSLVLHLYFTQFEIIYVSGSASAALGAGVGGGRRGVHYILNTNQRVVLIYHNA